MHETNYVASVSQNNQHVDARYEVDTSKMTRKCTFIDETGVQHRVVSTLVTLIAYRGIQASAKQEFL